MRTRDLGGNATTAETTEAVLEELEVSQADLIWMNGEFVAYEDAKVHVLTHALHYGTGVFEGVRAYEHARRRHARSSATPTTSTGCSSSAGSYYMDIPFSKEEIRAATLETIARNGLKSCYIRPLVFRGAGPMGLYPLDCPVEVIIAVWEWGAYLGDEGKRNGVRAKVSCWRRIPPTALIPPAKADGPVPQLGARQDRGRQGRLRGGDPARRPRLGLRGHGREPLRRQGRRDRHAAASPATSSAGINRTSVDRDRRATSATRSSSATSPAASSTWPTRSS